MNLGACPLKNFHALKQLLVQSEIKFCGNLLNRIEVY